MKEVLNMEASKIRWLVKTNMMLPLIIFSANLPNGKDSEKNLLKESLILIFKSMIYNSSLIVVTEIPEEKKSNLKNVQGVSCTFMLSFSSMEKQKMFIETLKKIN